MKPLSRRKVLVEAGRLALAGVVFTRPLIGEQRIEQQLQSRMTSFSFGDHLTQGLVGLEDNAPPPIMRSRQGRRAILDSPTGWKIILRSTGKASDCRTRWMASLT